MQDESLGGCNREGLILDLPLPLWAVIREDPPPRALFHLSATDNVVNAAVPCGCLLVRQRRYVRELIGKGGAATCPVCKKQGDQNGQEQKMLAKVRALIKSRTEDFLIFCQLPLPDKLRCDVLVVPREAQAVDHLIGLELDGTSHGHNPVQYNSSSVVSYNATVASDNRKSEAVRGKGMRFVRVSWSSMQSSETWHSQLSCELDAVMQAIMHV